MLLSTTFPAASANVDRYGYDSANQLVSIAIAHGPSMLASLSDTRDPVGLLGSEAQTALPGAANTSYSYTALNQLATADSRSYAYDAADNLVKLDGTSGYGYDAANELTAGPSGTATATTSSASVSPRFTPGWARRWRTTRPDG